MDTMLNKRIERLLSGKDLRSLGNSNALLYIIKSQYDFDVLFSFMTHKNRVVSMRAADVIEKITAEMPGYLAKHKEEVISLCKNAANKELKWHLADMVTRVSLLPAEFDEVWGILKGWVTDTAESRIVRAISLQAMFRLQQQHNKKRSSFLKMMEKLATEQVPSLNAKIRSIQSQLLQ